MTRTNIEGIYERYDIEEHIEGLEPSYNVAPSQDIPVILSESPNHIEMMLWGLIPFWSKEEKLPYSTINAKIEGIEKKPTFRKPIKSQRCIIPTTGFYEWKRTDNHKIPYFIFLKDEPVFGFAGLYDIWEHQGKKIKSCTIITTEPNKFMSKIHHRMPVILRKENESDWLNNSQNDIEHVLSLLKPVEAARMDAYQVSDKVNNPRNNIPDLIKKQS